MRSLFPSLTTLTYHNWLLFTLPYLVCSLYSFLTDYTKIDRKAVQPSYERGRGARRFLSFNHLQESLIADDILAPPASPGKAFSGGTNCERKLPRGSFSRLTNFDRVRRAQTTYVSTSDVTASSSDPDVADSIPHVAVSRPREHAKSKRKGRGNILSRIFRRGRSSAEAAPSSNAVPSEVDAEATSVAHSFQRSSIDGYHRRTMPSTPSPSRSLHARKGSVDLWAMDPLTPDDGYTIQRQEICDSASTVSDDSEHEYRGGQSRGGPVCATSAPRSLSMTNRMLKRTVGKFANVHGMVDRRMSVSDLSMSPSPTNP